MAATENAGGPPSGHSAGAPHTAPKDTGLTPTPKPGRPTTDRWARFIGVFALLLTGMNIWFTHFRRSHELQVTIFGYQWDRVDQALGAQLLFRNLGNQTETLLQSGFLRQVPWDPPAESWPNDRYVLAPIILGPGEIALRELSQPIDTATMLERWRDYGGDSLEAVSRIAMDFVVADSRGIPKRTVVPVLDLMARRDGSVHHPLIDTPARGVRRVGPFSIVDLFASKRAGLVFRAPGPRIVSGLPRASAQGSGPSESSVDTLRPR